MAAGQVLIVDDKQASLKFYSRSLLEAGFEVTQATSGRRALQKMDERAYDAVVTDLRMPKMDGLALLKQIRARSLEVPVILMVDAPDSRAAVRAAKLGAVQALVRPVSREVLMQSALHAVGLAGSSRRPSAGLNSDVHPLLSEAQSIPATAVKNQFGQVLERVLKDGLLVVTKHDAPKAILMSLGEFNRRCNPGSGELDTLSCEFDELLARMQTGESRARMKAAFGASTKRLGQSAVAAARKRA